jgi:hypothetical protein
VAKRCLNAMTDFLIAHGCLFGGGLDNQVRNARYWALIIVPEQESKGPTAMCGMRNRLRVR